MTATAGCIEPMEDVKSASPAVPPQYPTSQSLGIDWSETASFIATEHKNRQRHLKFEVDAREMTAGRESATVSMTTAKLSFLGWNMLELCPIAT